jgi:GT2 family glycosyltransferase
VEVKTAAIIVNWNNSKDTLECIGSLAKSDLACKIIVVDNGSRKDDVSILRTVSGIALIECAENIGFGRGNNVGIRWVMKNTDCEYIFLLNNDATCEPDVISLIERTMDEHREIGIAAPRIVYYHEPDMLWYGGGEISWARCSAKVPGFMGSARSILAMKERNVSFVSGCAMFIRRKVFTDVGGFDPHFFMYEEDVELSIRVREAGWKLRYIPQAVVKHKVQGGQKQGGKDIYSILSPRNPKLPFYLFHIVRNRLLNMFIHAHGINFLIFLLIFPLYLIKKIFEYSCYRRFDGITAILKGIASFYRERHKPFVNELMNEL